MEHRASKSVPRALQKPQTPLQESDSSRGGRRFCLLKTLERMQWDGRQVPRARTGRDTRGKGGDGRPGASAWVGMAHFLEEA